MASCKQLNKARNRIVMEKRAIITPQLGSPPKKKGRRRENDE